MIEQNVIDLMIRKIRDLAPDTHHVLQLAACMGPPFDLATLSLLHQKSPRQTASDLGPAFQLGLLVPIGEGTSAHYEFPHERVQQALYASLPEGERARIRLELAQVLKSTSRELTQKNLQLSASLQQIHELQRQLLVQEKLASLGTLAAGIAHEIKNPLNFVKNFSEFSIELVRELREELDLVRAELQGPSHASIQSLLGDLGQNVEKIHEHGTRIDTIVRSMLSLSRDSSLTREPTQLNVLVGESLNLAYHGMRAADMSFNVTLKTDYDPLLAELPVVPHNLGRALLNMSNNAFYATQEKHRLLGGAFTPEVRVSTKDLGEYAEIRIRDNGPGIPADIAANIFTPFFTTKPTGKGTGLGLSICHEIIVQQHQGSISVDTHPGEYTEFIVRLPKQPTGDVARG